VHRFIDDEVWNLITYCLNKALRYRSVPLGGFNFAEFLKREPVFLELFRLSLPK